MSDLSENTPVTPRMKEGRGRPGGMSVSRILSVIFFLAALVPQQAVLVPGYCMLLEWCLQKKAASGVWISLAVIGIGCAVEGYVNPFILKAVMRLFWG